MAFNFFGVYFESENGTEYRCGFHDNNTQYMPTLEKRTQTGWITVTQGNGTGPANRTCQTIRQNLPITIPFPTNPRPHTQNERMELINQIVYNISRYTTERVNYQGAHG